LRDIFAAIGLKLLFLGDLAAANTVFQLPLDVKLSLQEWHVRIDAEEKSVR